MENNACNLLPCPFCGGPAVCDDQGHLDLWWVGCTNDLCFSPWTEPQGDQERLEAINNWNTRIVNGNRVTFHWEHPGVISPTSVWLVSSGNYLYGPCYRWQDVEKLVREEWENDRNLVGY